MTYQINGWIRFSEEDLYQEGCLPNTGTMYSDNQVFKSDTLDGLIQQIYFDTDEQSELLGWVVRINESFSYDGFHTLEEAELFLAELTEEL